MIRAAALATVLTITPCVAFAAPGPFPAYAFLQKTPKATGFRWPWPKPAQFEDTWTKDARVIQLFEGSIDIEGKSHSGIFTLWPRDDGQYDLRLFFANVRDQQWKIRNATTGTWTVVAAPVAGGVAKLQSGEKSLSIEVSYASKDKPAQAGAWTDWTYTTTLLTSTAPVYEKSIGYRDAKRNDALFDNMEQAKSDDEKREALAALIASKIGASDPRWEKAIAVAKSLGDSDLVVAMYGKYRPMGRCSMDTYPVEVAKQFGDYCYQNGKLGCFLQLQMRIMGDYFDRVAQSSYGEEAHATHSGRLATTGVTPDRFLRGALYQFAGSQRIELDLWRMARAINESTVSEQMYPALDKAIADSSLDEYNRVRATVTKAYAELRKIRAAKGKEDRAEIAAKIEQLGVSPISQAWLDMFASVK